LAQVVDDLSDVGIRNLHLKDFFRLLRPHFLLGSLMLFLIGSTYAGGRAMDLGAGFIVAIVTVVMVQLAGQLANDYFDREGDLPSQRSLFAGGSGVIQTGSISASAVLLTTIAVCTISLFLAAFVAYSYGRTLFLPLIVLGLAGGLAYSAPPVRLVSSRFGELSIALLIGFVLPLTGWYYAKGSLDLEILTLGLPLFLFTLQSLIAVEFPDMEADLASGKRNMTFRLGVRRSKYVQIIVLGFSYLVVLAEVALGYLGIGALLIIATVPLFLYGSRKLIMMKDYDFNLAKTASNIAMLVNGISMAIMLIFLTYLAK
jgi:1,4-dihydroxy-2-naphthoate octaprenyltransferase